MSYEGPHIQESGYPEPGYYRICVFGPDDESFGLPAMDRLLTREDIERLDMTGMILDRIDQREDGSGSTS